LNKFKFKLDVLLKLRKERQERIQFKMASARRRLSKSLEDLKTFLNHRNSIAQSLEDFKTNPCGIDDLIIYQGYLEALDLRLIELELRIQKNEREVEEIRKLLVIASQEKRIVEKIKEKQKNRHLLTMLKLENKFLDEIGNIKNARKIIGLN